MPTKLLKKEGDFRAFALILQIAKPGFLRWAAPDLALTSGYQPMNTLKIQIRQSL